jgi:hypothetical protein
VGTREACEWEIHSRTVATKQGVPEDFWFKPYIGKFNGEKFAEENAQKRLAFQFVALHKWKTLYQPLN